MPTPQAGLIFEDPRKRLLTSLCYCLQRHWGQDRSFFLSARQAGKVLGTDHMTAWRLLQVLEMHGIICETRRGSCKDRRASEWKYIAADDPDAVDSGDLGQCRPELDAVPPR